MDSGELRGWTYRLGLQAAVGEKLGQLGTNLAVLKEMAGEPPEEPELPEEQQG